MATVEAVADSSPSGARKRTVNDMSIQVATVNGSGSQTANTILLRAIFQMGIPVSGKNIFPSNIAGLPTWYTIRVNHNGYIARKKEIDCLVAMNPETAKEDVLNLTPGASVVYDEPLRLRELRQDLVFYPIPFDKIVAPVCPDARLRRLVRNMIYVGALARLLGIEMQEAKRALDKQLGRKPKALTLNWNAIQAGFEYADKNLPKSDGCSVERLDKTTGKILIDGNAAAALGCMFAGVTFLSWYPITPSSSLAEALIDYLSRYRLDPKTNLATYAVVQAEDELAALGMAVGAGWAGVRAMTTTSGPGVSLMSEFAGLAYFTEIPVVIFDIQRTGPSTGLPTRTMQGDILSTAFLSHGDTSQLLLFPNSVEECYAMAQEAFDLAEEFQTPVFVMSDLDIGMNNWMADPFPYPEKPIRRGKVLSAADLERIQHFERYRDVDGDGICYRTLPGTDHPLAAYFTRGERPQRKGRLQRAVGRLPEQHGPLEAQIRDRPRAASGPRHCRRPRRRDRHHRLRQLALGRAREPRPIARRAEHSHRLPPPTGVSFQRRHLGLRQTHEARLSGRAEPRRADVRPGALGRLARLQQGPQRPALHRLSD